MSSGHVGKDGRATRQNRERRAGHDEISPPKRSLRLAGRLAPVFSALASMAVLTGASQDGFGLRGRQFFRDNVRRRCRGWGAFIDRKGPGEIACRHHPGRVRKRLAELHGRLEPVGRRFGEGTLHHLKGRPTKVFEDKRSRTWVTVTRKGRAAFALEVATMRALLDGVGNGGQVWLP